MQTVAFYATLFNHNRATSGIAMRTAAQQVFFQAESTGVWTELFDTDAANLHLHGRLDLTLAARLEDGDLVMRTSRTVPRRTAA